MIYDEEGGRASLLSVSSGGFAMPYNSYEVQMNIPNRLTILRLIMVPVFFISYSISLLSFEGAGVVSAVMMFICYAIAELSDLLDGKIARKYNLVTDLGKVMDPFADTLSHLTFFVCFMSYGIMPAWAFVIIMWREFSILFMRMLMMRAGKAMPANIWGKSKTVLYAIASIFSIVYIVAAAFAAPGSWNSIYETLLYVLFSLSAAASLLSFVTYLSTVLRSGALSGMTR